MMKHLATILLVGIMIASAYPVLAQQTLAEAKNPVVWQVNDDPIYAAEISMTMQTIAAQSQQAGGPAPNNEELMQAATERLIEQKLLVQEARRLAIRNNKERLSKMVAQMEQQAGGRERIESMLASAGSSYEQAVNLLQERDLVIEFIDQQVAPSITVTEEEIRDFFDENPDMFKTGEQVKVRHIIFEVPANASQEAIDEARAKAEAAHKRAISGEDFAALAKELSEGPSASAGGDLGTFEPSKMVPPFAKALETLKPGEISNVVRTDFGFHVIKLEDSIPAGEKTFEEAHDRISAMLRQQKITKSLNSLLETLRANSEINPVMPS